MTSTTSTVAFATPVASLRTPQPIIDLLSVDCIAADLILLDTYVYTLLITFGQNDLHINFIIIIIAFIFSVYATTNTPTSLHSICSHCNEAI